MYEFGRPALAAESEGVAEGEKWISEKPLGASPRATGLPFRVVVIMAPRARPRPQGAVYKPPKKKRARPRGLLLGAGCLTPLRCASWGHRPLP